MSRSFNSLSKTDRDNDVTKWRFQIFCEKCQVGDVTVGGRRVVFTFGFLFPVMHDFNCLTCSGDFLGNAYFRLDSRSKVWKKWKKWSMVVENVFFGIDRCLIPPHLSESVDTFELYFGPLNQSIPITKSVACKYIAYSLYYKRGILA